MALKTYAIEDPGRALEVVKLLTGSSTAPRLAMRGASMLPLLHEPMVLALSPAGSADRVGDVVVFDRGGLLVAHRITSLRGGFIQTCGDAVPWSPEYPEPGSMLGKVETVWASDEPSAARIDTLLFRLRGLYKARFRGVRAMPFQAKALGRRMLRALPWRRPRAYVTLVQAMSAAVRGDRNGFERALRLTDPPIVAAVARRHGCSATLVETTAQMKIATPEAAYLQRTLQDVGRSVVLRGMAVRAQASEVSSILSRAGISFALLKGAARLYSDEPGAMLQASSDLDILVRTIDLEAAAAALRAQGYGERHDKQKQEDYLTHHHHAAPLFPAGNGCAIELHVALAPPGALSIPLDWGALEAHMVRVEGPAGSVLSLDDVGAALHYAVHSVGLLRLRDTVLFARLLRRLDNKSLDELRRIVKSERIDPIRLDAAVALAARMAGVPWPVSGSVEEYLRWCMRREDAPLYFSRRSQLAEGWYAGDRRITPLMWRILDPRSRLGAGGARPAALSAGGRVLTGTCAYLYARAMRPLI